MKFKDVSFKNNETNLFSEGQTSIIIGLYCSNVLPVVSKYVCLTKEKTSAYNINFSSYSISKYAYSM